MSNNVLDFDDQYKPKTSGSKRIFVDAPAGVHNAVVVDYEVKENVPKIFNGESWVQDEIRYIYQVEDTITKEDLIEAARGAQITENDLKQVGRRYLVFGPWENFKLSHSKATKQTKFSETVAKIQGKPVGDDELDEFRPVSLIGRNVTLVLTVSPDKRDPNKLWTNISGIAPRKIRAGESMLEPKDYVRKKDRQPPQAAAA